MVVEITFGWIISQEAVHQDLLFFLCPPLVGTVLAFEACSRFGDGRWHHEESNNPNDYTDESLEKESDVSKSVEA